MGGGRIELILNNVLLALQVCLAIWQFMKLTLVRALIQGVVGWLLQQLGLSPTYHRLQNCGGRVFKRANCFVLQADIPSGRKGIEADEADRLDTIRGWYLGRRFLLEKRGSERNMLFINGKMCYYITPTIWNELLTFGEVLLYGVPGSEGAASVDACADVAAATRVAIAPHYSSTVFVKGYRRCCEEVMPGGVMPFELFVKGYRHCYRRCWEGVTTGGVMTFDEVVDGIILHNQHVSVCFNDHWFLPINLSVAEEQFLHFFNLAGLFLHAKVHSLIPTSMSFLISASMEFSPTLRVWFYTLMNMWFCYIMQFKPSHHIELKSSAITLAIITAGAKVEKEGATLVPWLHVANEENTPEKQFRWNSNGITCNYVVGVNKCHIRAPTIRTFSVECNSTDDFRHIITLVSCIERNQCRSLNSWDGPNNKVFVRGLKESVLAYVKNGCPPVYELVLNVDELVPNVVVT